MKTKYKLIFGILTVIVCILFGCEKRGTVSFEELTATEAEPLPDESGREKETAVGKTETDEASAGETAAGEPSAGEAEGNTLPPMEEEVLVVHICGAVNSPGVYELPAGSRIYQAVLAAGGFLEEADRDFLNQAQMIGDGSRIYVPTKEEASLAGEGPQEFISGGLEGPAEGGTAADSGLVNINTASLEELCGLSGIGSGKAESIINYRRENGDFHTIEEIMNVEGIKDGLFQKIKDRITV